MDSAHGCSKARPPEVWDGRTALCHQAASFIKLYDRKEARLRDLHGDIQDIGTRVRKWATKSQWSFYTGLVSAAVAVAAGLTVPFTGAVGFAITAALTSVAAGGAMFGFKIKQFRTEEESLQKIKQFLKIANRLEHELDELMKLCDSLQGRGEKAELPDVSALASGLEKLFQAMDTFRAADGANGLTAQCQAAFHQLGSARKQLEQFSGPPSPAEKLPPSSVQTPADRKGSSEMQSEAENGCESSALLDRGDRKAEGCSLAGNNQL